MMKNPLLDCHDLPPFSAIDPNHAEPAIDHLLAEGRALIERLSETAEHASDWEHLVLPLERLEERLGRAWSPISHLNAVVNSEALRSAYNACLPKLSQYHSELGQNEALFQAYQRLAEGGQLNPHQHQVVEQALRDFRLSGVALPPAEKERFTAIDRELSALSSRFAENLLDATNAWSKPFADPAPLAGLPDSALAMAQQSATQRGLEGWLLTLEGPSYLAVLTHAEDRELRREVYTAYATRASDQGPHAGQWDNSEVIEQILRLRHEQAQLLGFAHYADYSLARKMAPSSEAVLTFLLDLAGKSRAQAEQEYQQLAQFAQQQGVATLEAWDIGYYAEKLRQQRYAIQQEELRPYFPETRVIPGLFRLLQQLFGVTIAELPAVDGWHPEVRLFALHGSDGALRGRFYLDLYARPHKRGGAWMDSYCNRFLDGDQLQTPVAYLVCNATPPLGDRPALFTHDEVTTLFHEFGHGIHHLLTQIDYPEIAGINGVEWDAVELPSQLLENWCWQPESLQMISGHWESGEPLPENLLQRMLAARNFQAAMKLARQLEFALFDMRLHRDYQPAQGANLQPLLAEVRAAVAVVRPPAFNRFAHGFSHIFAGGYAAGYYAYKWAELLSADAFSRFEEEGVLNPQTGRDFLHHVLEQGGSREAMALFQNFRGRPPRIEPLLRHSGIDTTSTSPA